ncbi:hypothetical protein F7R12_29710 [Pseudomonas tolaasii]|nr:hypothetical protein F7R12_29710 [Pseudomonas tolaasii]
MGRWWMRRCCCAPRGCSPPGSKNVGAGLPAIAVYQPKTAGSDRPLSQASQLPHWIDVALRICVRPDRTQVSKNRNSLHAPHQAPCLTTQQ